MVPEGETEAELTDWTNKTKICRLVSVDRTAGRLSIRSIATWQQIHQTQTRAACGGNSEKTKTEETGEKPKRRKLQQNPKSSIRNRSQRQEEDSRMELGSTAAGDNGQTERPIRREDRTRGGGRGRGQRMSDLSIRVRRTDLVLVLPAEGDLSTSGQAWWFKNIQIFIQTL